MRLFCTFLIHSTMKYSILAAILVMPIYGSSSTHVGKVPTLALVKAPRIEKMQQRIARPQIAPRLKSKTSLISRRRTKGNGNSWLTTSNEISHQRHVPKWSLCDALQGFLTWRFAQSQSLIVGFLAFLFNLHIPILGPYSPTSYLYGWIACGFIEGFFGDVDVEGDNGISIDILAMAIVWGCLKSFRLSKARALAAKAIAIANKKSGDSRQATNQCSSSDEGSRENDCRQLSVEYTL